MTRRRGTLVMTTTDGASPTSAWLVIAAGTQEERRIPVGASPVRIGSEAGCDLLLDDPHVSRRHAEVRLSDEGVFVRDLGSRNGTFVDGVAIKEVQLHDGAVITVGKTMIKAEIAGGTRSSPPILPEEIAQEVTGPQRLGDAVGASAAMRRVFGLLARLAPTELTITLTGETGTGKDVLARAVHAASARGGGPFVVFDCGAAAPSLIESELFGHEKGAFTGASGERRGAFERAHGGTLFLDEVGELALDLQPKLLRALEQRRVRRVGGGEDLQVDVRILAATNRDLEEEVRAGRFREDLYFRLSAAIVKVPALRERLDDVPALVDAILASEGLMLSVAPETLDVLRSYDWPGNVRELRNVILGAAALVEGNVLQPRDLMFFRPRRREPTVDRLPLGGRSLESIERAAIAQTLRHTKGNKVKAAQALGIAPSTLYEKIKKYGLT